MKILHITNAYPYSEYSSYGIFIKEQIDSLERLGIKNEIVFINANEFGNREYIKCIKILNQQIEEGNPDIIHCHHEFSLLSTLFSKTNRPVILSLLGDINKRSRLNKIIFKILHKSADSIIVKNEAYNHKNFRYIPNGVNLAFFKPIDKLEAKRKLKLDLEKRYILFVTASLNNPIKRYDKFLNILEGMNKKGEAFTPLIMTGVFREDVPFYFNSSEFLLLTSDHEGSPNAVKEAMACNLPIVSTNVGNVKELFGQTKGNFLSESGTVEEMVSLSFRASNYEESEGRNRLKLLGLEMESVAKKIERLYKELLK